MEKERKGENVTVEVKEEAERGEIIGRIKQGNREGEQVSGIGRNGENAAVEEGEEEGRNEMR